MRELDVLLTSWLEEEYPQSDETDKTAFRKLLELADPDLISYLLSGALPSNPEIASVVRRIRGESSS